MSLCCLKNLLFNSAIIAIGVVIFKFIYNYFTSNNLFTKLKNKRIVITGGSSGIGLSLAKLAYQNGAQVTIVARSLEKLKIAQEKICAQVSSLSGAVDIITADVCADYEVIHKNMQSKLGKTDILINCAGGALSRTYLDTSHSDIENQMRLNYFGSANMTKIFLPAMLEAKTSSNIVFVSSMAGQTGVYGFAAYSASKFALRGLAESLKMEVGHRGVDVTLAFPPDTRTPGYENEQIGKPETTKRLSAAAGLIEPDYVAECVWRSVLSGHFFASVGLDGWFLTLLTHGMCLPDSVLGALLLIVLSPVVRVVAIAYGVWMRYIVRTTRDDK